ncbi:MAG: patatin-like phospholipase family protein [Anaerolineales bacterium]|nr:patatin-like phospholipase family protein [Anaerolineales bacterium]
MPKKTALVLSGGGAKGAFQVGAEKYAREVRGYKWDIIAGVSVGALNGGMLAIGKYERLLEIWNTISADQIYTGGFNFLSTIKLLFGAKSFYGNEPIWRMLQQEFEQDKIRADLRVGAVSLMTGEYVEFRADDPNLTEAILASTAIPIIWEPVDVSHQHRSMVDGGVRNISPIGDVLDSEPDEIVIINCSPEKFDVLPEPPDDIVKIGTRTLDILLNELFRSDMREFVRINHLVEEAAARGVTLHHPTSGRTLKYYQCKIIEPDFPLGETLDFSQEAVQRSLQAGVEKARQVLEGVRRIDHD